MANLDLSGVLATVGAPFLKKMVEGSLPPPLNNLGGIAVDVLADRLGASAPTPEAVVQRYEANPTAGARIIKELEADPAAILAGVEQQKATNQLLLAEMKEPLWTWAWRPLGMYGLGMLWFWNLIILHLLNWWWKSSLPQTDLGVLFNISAAYMGLYMGGHTIKDFVAKKWGGEA